MKKIHFTLIILLILTSCAKNDEETQIVNELEIAKIIDNNYVINNKIEIINKIEKQYKEKKSNFSISDVYIDVSKAEDDENITIIQLVAENNDGSTKIAYLLDKIDDKLFLNPKSSGLECSGCRRGCSPRRDSNGDGWCTDCKIQNSSCTKTETELTHAFD